MKINYDELDRLVDIADTCDGSNDRMIEELLDLKKLARFNPSRDFCYDVIQLLNKYYPTKDVTELIENNECYARMLSYINQ